MRNSKIVQRKGEITMVSYEVQKIIENLYKKCETLQEVTELQEELQGINNTIAGDRWTDLCTED